MESESFVGQYKILHQLGKGSCVKVKLAQDIQTGQQFAIKVLNKVEDKNRLQKYRNQFEKEFENMKTLSHQNLLKVVEFLPNIVYTRRSGEKYETIALVMELALGGDLWPHILRQPFDEILTRTLFSQLVDSLEYMHKQGLAHKNIRPENILFGNDYKIKLADFGLSNQINGFEEVKSEEPDNCDISFLAPEIHRGEAYLPQSADIFALGVILFMMRSGKQMPFRRAVYEGSNACTNYKYLHKQRHAEWWESKSKKFSEQNYFSKELKSLINSLFSSQADQRPTLSEIKGHPWMQGTKIPENEYQAKLQQRYEFFNAHLQHQIKDHELKKVQENQLKQSKPNNTRSINSKKITDIFLVFSGIYVRSEGQINNVQAKLQQFKDVDFEKERQIKICKRKVLKITDFLSDKYPQYLFSLLLYKSEHFCPLNVTNKDGIVTETSNSIQVDQNSYIINFMIKDENSDELSVKVEFQKKDDKYTYVHFKKISGSTFEYEQFILEIQQALTEELVSEQDSVEGKN